MTESVETCPLKGADKSVCSVADQTMLHPSGLRTMSSDAYPLVPMLICYTVEFPAGCCPVSHNPQPGSTLTFQYKPAGRVLEVYSLRSLLRKFVGGWPGNEAYGPERNMEGSVQLICQMAADAIAVRVKVRARLQLDTGLKVVSATAMPARTWDEIPNGAGTPPRPVGVR